MQSSVSSTLLYAEASEAFSDALSYDTGRFSFPTQCVKPFLANIGLAQIDSGSGSIVELGAGTGKFTKSAITVAPWTAHRWIAVEPVDSMRTLCERNVDKFGVRTVAAGASSVPEVEDGVANAIICAQSFHWFANVEALQEIYRMLSTNGVFALIWYQYDTSCQWMQQLQTILRSSEYCSHDEKNVTIPRTRWETKDKVWNTSFARDHFTALKLEKMIIHEESTVQSIVTSVISASPAGRSAASSDDTRKRINEAVVNVLNQNPETTGRDRLQVPYIVTMQWCRKCSSVEGS